MSSNIWERGFTSLVKHVTMTTDESPKAFFFFKYLSVLLRHPTIIATTEAVFMPSEKPVFVWKPHVADMLLLLHHQWICSIDTQREKQGLCDRLPNGAMAQHIYQNGPAWHGIRLLSSVKVCDLQRREIRDEFVWLESLLPSQLSS